MVLIQYITTKKEHLANWQKKQTKKKQKKN